MLTVLFSNFSGSLYFWEIQNLLWLLHEPDVVVAAETRMSYFVAGLTNEDPNSVRPVYKHYHHVQYKKKVPASATASVYFPPCRNKYRYVIIQNKFTEVDAICLAEVKVFLRGILYVLLCVTQ